MRETIKKLRTLMQLARTSYGLENAYELSKMYEELYCIIAQTEADRDAAINEKNMLRDAVSQHNQEKDKYNSEYEAMRDALAAFLEYCDWSGGDGEDTETDYQKETWDLFTTAEKKARAALEVKHA